MTSSVNQKPKTKTSQPINDDWWNETAVCIGGGPSLTPEDVEFVHGKAHVIAVNDAYRIAPWAEILWACDLKWWQWHDGAKSFAGERWTQDATAADEYGINYIRGIEGQGLSKDPMTIHTGQNSGFQAINFAYHKGARRVILLGYDMAPSDDGRTHWFGEHPKPSASPYTSFIRRFKTIADQGAIEVINCSRRTALNCFPKMPLEDILWT